MCQMWVWPLLSWKKERLQELLTFWLGILRQLDAYETNVKNSKIKIPFSLQQRNSAFSTVADSSIFGVAPNSVGLRWYDLHLRVNCIIICLYYYQPIIIYYKIVRVVDQKKTHVSLKKWKFLDYQN